LCSLADEDDGWVAAALVDQAAAAKRGKAADELDGTKSEPHFEMKLKPQSKSNTEAEVSCL